MGTSDPVPGRRETGLGWVNLQGRAGGSPALAGEWWGSTGPVPRSTHQAQLEAQQQQMPGAGTAADQQRWQPKEGGLQHPAAAATRALLALLALGGNMVTLSFSACCPYLRSAQATQELRFPLKPISLLAAQRCLAWILAQHTRDTTEFWHPLSTHNLSRSLQLLCASGSQLSALGSALGDKPLLALSGVSPPAETPADLLGCARTARR